jgi:hypothetical protein
LSSPSDLPLELCLHRRVTPTSWEQKAGRAVCKPGVFTLRERDRGLSVYRADLVNPRAALQICINENLLKLASDDEDTRKRAAGFFALYGGDTVESFVQAGWRVARIPISAFTDRGFTLEPPDATGHLNVIGPREQFQRYSRELKLAGVILSKEDCLAM